MTVVDTVSTPILDRSLTAELSHRASGLHYEDLSTETLEVARHCVLDWLGVTLAGSREPLSNILVEQVAESDGQQESTLLGRSGRRVGALNAALINGATSHALDFDDTHSVMSGHPSVPVIPAALAIAEREGRSGRDFLTAVVAGIEVECRLGDLVNPSHYQAGFHATGTLGTLGAAAAAAHLLHLSDEHWPHALALAATQAAGLKRSFGTMAKPLHAGKAAYEGLLSALLARGGFTGNPEILESSKGFADTHGARDLPLERLLAPRSELLICDTLFKYHAACYLTHSSIDGARQILDRLERDGVSAEQIDSVILVVSPASLEVCNILEPRTGLEGKFSLRATTAMSLLGLDMSDLSTYSDATVISPEVVDLRDKVHIEPTSGTSPTCTNVVVGARGKSYDAAIEVGEPDRDLERQERRLSDKFLALTTPICGAEQAAALRAAVRELPSATDVSGLLA